MKELNTVHFPYPSAMNGNMHNERGGAFLFFRSYEIPGGGWWNDIWETMPLDIGDVVFEAAPDVLSSYLVLDSWIAQLTACYLAKPCRARA